MGTGATKPLRWEDSSPDDAVADGRGTGRRRGQAQGQLLVGHRWFAAGHGSSGTTSPFSRNVADFGNTPAPILNPWEA